MKISLCCITGNEQAYAERFLDSFGPAFDELCLVRALGTAPHDKTVSLAKAWCEKNGKEFKFAEYRNEGWCDGVAYAAPETNVPASWPHVDDFARARNVAWDMATGDWKLWADLDDVLLPGSAEQIRKDAGDALFDIYLFTYEMAATGDSNFRERLFHRKCAAQWVQPIHETCRCPDPSAWKVCHDKSVVFSHAPDIDKQREPHRNRRILEHALRWVDAFASEIHRELYFEWQRTKEPELLTTCSKWSEVAQVVEQIPEWRLNGLLYQSDMIAAQGNLDGALDFAWAAARAFPFRRDPWGTIAELEIKLGRGARALFAVGAMANLKRPSTTGIPLADRFYGWEGFLLKTRALRCDGKEERAQAEENAMFEKNGRRISLLHATRGRPEKALECRTNFMRAAANQFAVEHIFAIDADDATSLEALKLYRNVIVKEPRGCVKAWNLAAEASSGHVLVQLSDDWMPCYNWDTLIWDTLTKAGDPTAKPMVLQVSDSQRNERGDGLLCMAVLTRARYKQQGHLFAPDYFGVFSDNEFSLRAQQDGVLVDGWHIKFLHQHPVYEGKPFTEWDDTHRRQNAPERYADGEATFRYRNLSSVRVP